MGEHYTDLVEQADSIKRIITLEEERFHRTMERGLNELDTMLEALASGGTLLGEKAFYLKATLGLPFQVTKDIVEERGFTVDETGFMQAEAEHARISGGGQAIGAIESADFYRGLLAELQSTGAILHGVAYNPYTAEAIETTVLALTQDGAQIENAIVGDKVEVCPCGNQLLRRSRRPG